MRITDPVLAAHLAARKPVLIRHMLWIAARNRATGAVEGLGLWDGDDHQDIVIDGQTRTYYGAGGLVSIEPIRHATGTDVRRVRATLAPMAPEVAMAIRGYDPRTAPVDIYRQIYDPETMQPVGGPVRRLKGRISEIELTQPAEKDGESDDAACSITIATGTIEGTRGLALKKSDESQKLRALPDGGQDRFYQYADISGKVPVKWGEE